MPPLYFRSASNTVKTIKNKDRYRIIGPLGRGTYSDVFNCLDEELNRIVALKKLREEFVSNQIIVESFLNEAKLLAFLEHPGLLMLYDIFLNENGAPCYTMKLVKGNNLRWECGMKTRAQFLNIFIKLCETMASVHDHGIVHLDLCPENILLGNYGEVVIIDWGNARLFDDKAYKEYLALLCNTPDLPLSDHTIFQKKVTQYYSPEQTLSTNDALSPSSDIFSMGVIFYEMLSGMVPFSSNDPAILAEQICTIDVKPLHEVNSSIPHYLSHICSKMMAKDPYSRYHSFHAVLTDLDRFQNSGQAFNKRTLHPGEVLFREGEAGDYAFIILSGTLEVSRISRGDRVVLAYLKPEEIGGELALFTNEQRSATITAVEETTIRILSRETVESELQKLSPWVKNMIYGLSNRIIKLNDYLVQ